MKDHENGEVMRIVIADDEPTNRLLGVLMLRRLGHEVHAVTDGAELIRYLESDWADVAFIDVHMPIMDGIAAAREIIRRWGDLTRPVMIALTANDDARVRQVCIASGMDGYLLKPITLQIFRESLAHWPTRPSDPRSMACSAAV